MRLAKVLITAAFFFYLLTGLIIINRVSAQIPTKTTTVEYTLPYPGILPDNPLYKLKLLRDAILELFTRDAVKKIHLHLLFSDKHLVMGQILWEKGNRSLSLETFKTGENHLMIAVSQLTHLKDKNNLPAGLADKLEIAAKKHLEILENIDSNANDNSLKNDLNNIISTTKQTKEQINSVK